MPSVAHDDRLPAKCIGRKRRKEDRYLRNVGFGGEFAVHSSLEHHVRNDRFLGNSELLREVGNLALHQGRAHEAGTDQVGPDPMARPSLATTRHKP